MQCNCGGQTEPRTYKVTLLDNARQWHPLVEPEHLPIRLELDVCKGCGRMQRKVYSRDKVLLWMQG
jgi:hypothetical protein